MQFERLTLRYRAVSYGHEGHEDVGVLATLADPR